MESKELAIRLARALDAKKAVNVHILAVEDLTTQRLPSWPSVRSTLTPSRSSWNSASSASAPTWVVDIPVAMTKYSVTVVRSSTARMWT